MLCAMVLCTALWSADPPAPPPAFSKTGPQVGDFLPRIKLTGVSDELGEWHPEASGLKLLVTSSYTCPKSRSRYPELRDLALRYKDSVKVVIVYVIEAHPLGDISPYKGVEDVTPENRRDGILFRQPKTFPVRLGLAQSFKQRFDIEMPIYLDGMDNRAWQALGGAPNMALLVDERERVIARQDWFDGAAMSANIQRALQDDKERQARNVHDAAVQKMVGEVTKIFREGPITEAARVIDAHPEIVNFVNFSPRGRYYETPLQTAILGKKADMVSFLLDRGADINSDTMTFGTPLEMAVIWHEIPILDLLIRRGAEVDRIGYDGMTALDHAAVREDAVAREHLLRAHAHHSCFSAAATGDIQALRGILATDGSRALRPDASGMTPLDYAAEKGQIAAARILIEEYGADPGFAHDEMYMAPIHYAIEEDRIEMVKFLIAAHADPGAESWGGNGLHIAASRGCVPVLRLLLDAGVNPNLVSGAAKDTPLLLAARCANADGLAALLDHGADISATTGLDPHPCGFAFDPYRDTALHLAVRAGRLENVRLLIARKIDINAANSNHDTALVEAALGRDHEEQRLPMLKALLEGGADANVEDADGKTLRDRLVEADEQELVPLLDGYGARTGSCALRSALGEGDAKLFRALIAKKVNVNGTDTYGNTALHFLLRYHERGTESLEILGLLLAAGADVNRENDEGKTPRDLGVIHLEDAQENQDALLESIIAHGARLGSGMPKQPAGPFTNGAEPTK